MAARSVRSRLRPGHAAERRAQHAVCTGPGNLQSVMPRWPLPTACYVGVLHEPTAYSPHATIEVAAAGGAAPLWACFE